MLVKLTKNLLHCYRCSTGPNVQWTWGLEKGAVLHLKQMKRLWHGKKRLTFVRAFHKGDEVFLLKEELGQAYKQIQFNSKKKKHRKPKKVGSKYARRIN